MAAINLFQIDLEKPWNYLQHCYEKVAPLPFPRFEQAGGKCPIMPPDLRRRYSQPICLFLSKIGKTRHFYTITLLWKFYKTSKENQYTVAERTKKQKTNSSMQFLLAEKVTSSLVSP